MFKRIGRAALRRRIRIGRRHVAVFTGLILILLTFGVAFSASNTVSASNADDKNQAVVAEDLDPPECDGANGVTITLVWQIGTARPNGAASELVLGGLGNDTAGGQGGTDCMVGGGGADTFTGGGGNTREVMLGGPGNDTLSGAGANDFLYGGDDNDIINGDAGNDSLYGGNGNDTLDGGAGADYLNGGPGIDVCTGGPGTDTYDASCETQNP